MLATTAPPGLIATAARNPDGRLAVVVANIAARPERYGEVVPRTYQLEVGGRAVELDIPVHAIQTVVVAPGGDAPAGVGRLRAAGAS